MDGVLNVVHRADELAIFERSGDSVVCSTRNAEWVFYLKHPVPDDKLFRALRADRRISGLEKDGQWTRVSCISKEDRRAVCLILEQNRYPTFEGDVAPRRRYLTDVDPKRAKPRMVFLDIETDSRVPFIRKEQARVLCWTLVWPDGSRRVGVLDSDTDAAEREILVRLWDQLIDSDLILAWNGERFDFPVIQARSRRYRIDVMFDRWLWLDQLTLFKRMNLNVAGSGAEKQSYALQAIATAVLGEGKDDFDASKTWEAWEAGDADRRRLVRYCVKDTDLLRRLELKTGYAEVLITIADVCNVFADDRGILPIFQVEGFLLRLVKSQDYKFRSKLLQVPQGKFEGAYVMDPGRDGGIRKHVHVADFSSLYPSIIATWNMSPETVLKSKDQTTSCVAPETNIRFRTDVPGVLSTAVLNLMELRKTWNSKKSKETPGTASWREADGRSMAYKVAANSFYGVMGNSKSSFFSVAVAGSTTACGRWLLKATLEEMIAVLGSAALYGDTDSGFSPEGITSSEFERFVDHCNSALYPKLLSQQGCKRNLINLAYEKEYQYIVFCGAKRYFGRIEHYKGTPAGDDTPPEVKGLEYKRGDTVRVAREMQAEVIDLLMGGGILRKRQPTCDHNPETYEKLVQRWQSRILTGELTLDDVKQSKTISRPLKDYKIREKKDGTPGRRAPHIELAETLKARGEDVREGTKVTYFIADATAEGGTLYKLASEWEGRCDRFELWERFVAPATLRVLGSTFPKIDWTVWLKVRPKKPRKKREKTTAMRHIPKDQNGHSETKTAKRLGT